MFRAPPAGAAQKQHASTSSKVICRARSGRNRTSKGVLRDYASLAAESLAAKSHECVAQYQPQQHSGVHTSASSSSTNSNSNNYAQSSHRVTAWQSSTAWSISQQQRQQQQPAVPQDGGSSSSSDAARKWPWSLWQQHSSSRHANSGQQTLLLEQSAAAVTEQHAKRRALLQQQQQQQAPARYHQRVASSGTSAAALVAVEGGRTAVISSTSYPQTHHSSSTGSSSWEESAAVLRNLQETWEQDTDSSSSSSSAAINAARSQQLFFYDLMPPAAAAAVAAEQHPSSASGADLTLLLGDTYPQEAVGQGAAGHGFANQSGNGEEQEQEQQQQLEPSFRQALQANPGLLPVPEPNAAGLKWAVRGVAPLGRPTPRNSSRSRAPTRSSSSSYNTSSSSSTSEDSDWLTAVLSVPTSKLSSHSNAVLTNSLRRLASLRNVAGGPAAAAAAGMDGPEGLLDSIRARFGTFQLQQFEEVALQLAQLGYQPDKDWLAAFDRTSMAAMQGGSPRSLSRLLLSRSKLGGPVSSEWCATCCQHMAAAPHKLSVSSWVNALYAVVRLKHTPSRHFQATFFAATAERLDDVSPELLTHLVWSLGRLRFSPSHMWWRSLVCAAAGIEKPFSHAQLASLIHSVALWAEPGGIAAQDVQCFVDLLLVEIDEHLGVLQPAELTTVVWALGSLAAAGKFTADAQLQSDLLSAVQDQLPRLSPLQCNNLCWGLAKLNHHLPDGFAEALLLEVQAQLTGFSNSNLCSVLWALARLELVPLAPFREQLWEELQHRIKSLVLPDLSTLLWALAQLQLQPPEDILLELCERSGPHISSCDATHLTNIVWALGRLQARPGREWVEAAEAASLQVMATAGLKQVVNLAWGLSRLRSSAAATQACPPLDSAATTDQHVLLHGDVSTSQPLRSKSEDGGPHTLSMAWQAACLRELRLRCMCAGADVDCMQLVQMLREVGVMGLAEGAAAAADKLFAEAEEEAAYCSLQFQPGCR